MDTPPGVPPLDPSAYEWTGSAGSCGQWRRPALAGETLWIPRAKDYHEMFIGGSLTLGSLVPPGALVVAVKAAWRRLRFEVPELVVSASYGAYGRAYMQYEEPTSAQGVNQWVERTTSINFGKKDLDFQQLLGSIRQEKDGHDSDQAFLLLHSVLEGVEDLVGRIDFILNADHQVVDGISVRILLGRFLTLFAISLSSPRGDDVDLDWGKSTKNLTPPWIGVVNDDQLLSGPEYQRVAELNKDFMFQKMPQNPGLPLLSPPNPLSLPHTASQKTHFITLTTNQSTALLCTIKQTISPKSNITHLGHAAMVLALLRAYPPGPHSQTLYSPCWLNGRRYLRPFPGQPTPMTSYLPICQSFAPVVFDGLQELALNGLVERGEVREKLIKACKVSTAEYGKIRERKSMLPESVVLFERLGKSTYLYMEQEKRNACNDEDFALLLPESIQNGISDRETARLNGSPKVAKSSSEAYSMRTADPFFLSDGITEQYIDREYFDNSASASRNRVFEVDHITFAANAEKNLIVRMSSWRDKITVSGEWKECDYDEEMILKFLEDMVVIMLSLIDQD